MRLNVKNFENEDRKIVWKQNGMFLNVFYYRKENGKETLDRFFFKVLENQGDLVKKLVEIFQRIEKYYGIELLLPQFKLEQPQLN